MLKTKKAAGDAISTLILFIAVVGISVGIVVAMKNYALETHDSLRVQNEIVNSQLKTSIDITNMYYNETAEQVVIFIKNIGETQLATKEFDIYVDDRYFSDYSVYEASDLSTPLEMLLIKQTAAYVIDISLSAGSHEVKAVSGFGGSGDTDYFNI